MTGYVLAHYDAGYVILADKNGTEYFAHVKNLLAPLNHSCLYTENSPVTFEIEFPADRFSRAVAKNVRLVDEPEFTETNVIGDLTSWNGTYGFARRQCRCGGVYVHPREIITLGIETLKPGSEIQFDTVRDTSRKGPGFKAVNIRIFQESE